MAHQTRLGGFKLLNDVVWISLVEPERDKGFPAEFCGMLAGEKINLLFLTCGSQGGVWGLDIVADPDNAAKVFELIKENFAKINYDIVKGSVLSLFPHKSDPEITAALLNVFGKEGIEPNALAYRLFQRFYERRSSIRPQSPCSNPSASAHIGPRPTGNLPKKARNSFIRK
ncbi:MAG: hypothetical protein JRJ21_09165 [Deltaproteobacteria bacterium]|nr:hypothetical protein [Deltaproteobacteria bacterium]